MGERLVDVFLRRLVVEAQADIQGEPGGDAPVVLNIKLGVPVLGVEHRAAGGLAVIVHVSQQAVGISVAGIVHAVERIRTEVEAARVGRSRGLNLVIVLQVSAELEAVLAHYLAQVVGIGPDGIGILIVPGGSPAAREVHGGSARHGAELELRQEVEIPVGGRSAGRSGGGKRKQHRSVGQQGAVLALADRKSTRLNSSHLGISYAVFCLKKKNTSMKSRHLVISYAAFCLSRESSIF